jgi:hypothetical protein
LSLEEWKNLTLPMWVFNLTSHIQISNKFIF